MIVPSIKLSSLNESTHITLNQKDHVFCNVLSSPWYCDASCRTSNICFASFPSRHTCSPLLPEASTHFPWIQTMLSWPTLSRSISKCLMWWHFTYSWWNIFKMHDNSIHFRCFRLYCGNSCKFSHTHEHFLLMPKKQTKRKTQQKSLCKGNLNTIYLIGIFVEILSIFKQNVVQSNQRKRETKSHKIKTIKEDD